MIASFLLQAIPEEDAVGMDDTLMAYQERMQISPNIGCCTGSRRNSPNPISHGMRWTTTAVTFIQALQSSLL